MKKRYSISAVVLAAFIGISVFGFGGCTGKTNLRVWSTYNTRKVMQTYGEYEDLGARLDVVMAKGETEGAQLLITPDRHIDSVILTSAALTSEEGNVFPESGIKIYIQKYINVTSKTPNQNNFDYPPGYTPDLLLPMETAAEYGETSVEKGHNQGFTVEFSTTSETEAGIYSGEFTLNADGTVTAVPVTLEVRDIDITQSHGKTYIGMLGTDYMNGEYNNTTLYQNYYETALNDYRFTCDMLPGAASPELFVQSVLRYWDNPHFTGYAIPYSSYSSSNSQTNLIVQIGELYSYMYALAKASEPDKILLERAFVYPISLDEPKQDAYDAVIKSIELFYEAEDRLYDQLVAEGFFNGKSESFREDMRHAITHIPFIQTATREQMNSVFGTSVNTYCSPIDRFNLAVAREEYAAMKAANADRGGETWFYTCMIPVYPYPSHHLDDYLIGARIMRWMQKDYGLDGYLHWSFNAYHKYGNGLWNIDPYEESSRFPNTQGDGFMFYPGKKYGIDTFLPSLRLTTFRDGQEDYDMLCVFDEIIREKESFYGLEKGTVSSELYVSELYDELFNGTVYNSDDATFYSVRLRLMDIIEEHRSESKYLLANEISGNEVVSSVYLAPGYDLTVNGVVPADVEASGEGYCYRVVQSLADDVDLNIVISRNGNIVEKHDVFVSAATKSLVLGEDGINLPVSVGSTINYLDGTAQVTLIPQEGASTLFRPYVRILGEGIISDSLSSVDAVSFKLTNNGTGKAVFYTRMYAGYGYEISKYELEAGESTIVRVEGLWQYSSEFADLDTAYFELYVDNVGDGKDFSISDLRYSLRRGNGE